MMLRVASLMILYRIHDVSQNRASFIHGKLYSHIIMIRGSTTLYRINKFLYTSYTQLQCSKNINNRYKIILRNNYFISTINKITNYLLYQKQQKVKLFKKVPLTHHLLLLQWILLLNKLWPLLHLIMVAPQAKVKMVSKQSARKKIRYG